MQNCHLCELKYGHGSQAQHGNSSQLPAQPPSSKLRPAFSVLFLSVSSSSFCFNACFSAGSLLSASCAYKPLTQLQSALFKRSLTASALGQSTPDPSSILIDKCPEPGNLPSDSRVVLSMKEKFRLKKDQACPKSTVLSAEILICLLSAEFRNGESQTFHGRQIDCKNLVLHTSFQHCPSDTLLLHDLIKSSRKASASETRAGKRA